MPELEAFDAGRIADDIHDALHAAWRQRGHASLAIPGGTSPTAVLAALAARLDEDLRPHMHLFWVDERAVPPGHQDRNDAAMLAAWRSGGADPGHIHPMPAERDDLDAAAQAYADELLAVHGGADGVIDVVLLGIGPDGHCASLFPEHPGLEREEPVFAVLDSPKPPPHRLSMSLPVLARARHRFGLVQGAAKGRVWAAAQAGRDPRIPISLLPATGTRWFGDQEARDAVASG